MSKPAPFTRDPFQVSWRERVLVLGTAASAVLLALVLGMLFAPEPTAEMLGLIPASMFVIGKFLPLWGIGKSHFTPWELGLVIWVLDTCTVLVVIYGLELLYSLGPLKRTVLKVQQSAQLVLTAYPRMRRAAVAGVAIFVLFPVAGTGAFVGSFLGILLGLGRLTLIAAVSISGLAGGMLMAFAAVNFREVLIRLREAQSDPLIKWASLVLVVTALVALFWWLNRAYRRALEQARKDLGDSGRA